MKDNYKRKLKRDGANIEQGYLDRLKHILIDENLNKF